jgi:hypothetical protein
VPQKQQLADEAISDAESAIEQSLPQQPFIKMPLLKKLLEKKPLLLLNRLLLFLRE